MTAVSLVLGWCTLLTSQMKSSATWECKMHWSVPEIRASKTSCSPADRFQKLRGMLSKAAGHLVNVQDA